MKLSKTLIAGVVAVGLSGCAQVQDRVQQMSWLEMGGTLGGAAAGGYIGAQFGGGLAQTMFIATGVLVGGSVGYNASRMLDGSDQASYESTVRQALNESADGQVVRWNNPETGRTGIFRPVASYRRADGQTCRKYRSSVVFDDGVFSGGGTACQLANGSWIKLHDEFS
ncbi:MAG: RT0821/Lpp0805 family surface protein [Rhodospirillaceae bacterium]